MQTLIIFNESFDALEFLDMIDKADVVDHFDLPEYKKVYSTNPYSIPSESMPHTIIMENINRYNDIILSFANSILEVCKK